MNLPPEILNLIHQPLKNFRGSRYDGTGFDVPLSQFVPADQKLLVLIYQKVQGLVLFWQSMREAPDVNALETFIQKIDFGSAMNACHQLGQA